MSFNHDQNLYDDARIYDILFGETPAQQEIDFYSTLIGQYGEPVLELACGTGRITILLAQVGFNIQGLDIAAPMINLAQQKTRAASLDIPYSIQDMRNFALDQKFGFIFVPHQSFQHLYTRSDVEGCLRLVRNHLLPNGAFLIQIFNPSPRVLTIDGETRFKTSKEFYVDHTSGERFFAEFRNRYELHSQILDTTYYYHTDSDATEKSFKLRMRQFFPQELDALIEYNGFEIIAKYGDNRFTPFEEKPVYQNVLCRPV
ncbi:MAG TPA: class I SAM-dependent methyltransferase [Bacillota bacterium]|nr:class I SAM-dependent methyltransferase [Bacillota bacterium]